MQAVNFHPLCTFAQVRVLCPLNSPFSPSYFCNWSLEYMHHVFWIECDARFDSCLAVRYQQLNIHKRQIPFSVYHFWTHHLSWKECLLCKPDILSFSNIPKRERERRWIDDKWRLGEDNCSEYSRMNLGPIDSDDQVLLRRYFLCLLQYRTQYRSRQVCFSPITYRKHSILKIRKDYTFCLSVARDV